MTINTQKLRKVAESANGFAGGDVAEWPLTAKSHIRSLASTVIQCADTIGAQAAEIARMREIVEMAAAGNAEYDVLQRRARATLSGESHG